MRSKPDTPAKQMPTDSLHNLGQQAVAALNRGDPGQAINLLQPVCHEPDTDPQLRHLLGAAFGMSGDFPSAEQAFRECLKVQPQYIPALADLGRVLAEQGKYDEALDIMSRVLTINPGHRASRVSTINALTRLEKYADAERHCKLLLKDNHSDVEALTLLGNILKAKSEFASALTNFRRALDINADYVPAHMNMGLTLQSMGKPQDAIKCFSQASLLAPDNPTVWQIKGMAHLAIHELEQAATDLEEAFRLNPRDTNAGGQLANIYRHLRRIPESVEISRKILAVDPENVSAKFYANAFGDDDGNQLAQRIPRHVVEATYSHKDVGKNFESSLKGELEYRAPDILFEAVCSACGNTQSSLDILELGCGTGLCGSRFASMARTLVGTDLSPSMLDVARKKDAYTDLYIADLVDVLSSNHDAFDLVIAMDVLCYFGDLTDIFHKCRGTLRSDGVFAFSVEKPDNEDLWQLHPYGHFVHSQKHLQQAATAAGFEEVFIKETILRREALEERIGFVCLFRRK